MLLGHPVGQVNNGPRSSPFTTLVRIASGMMGVTAGCFPPRGFFGNELKPSARKTLIQARKFGSLSKVPSNLMDAPADILEAHHLESLSVFRLRGWSSCFSSVNAIRHMNRGILNSRIFNHLST